jgi:diguanylate cyclase (GGDEF)-like protein
MSFLHLPTLLLVSGSVIFLLGLLMLLSWSRGRDELALLWMGTMLLLADLGLLLVVGLDSTPSLNGWGLDWVAPGLGNALFLLCAGMSWSVLRVFVGRRPRWGWLVAGCGLWLLLGLWPEFAHYPELRVKLFTLLLVGYGLAAMVELQHDRQVLNVSMTPFMALLSLHLVFFLVRLFLDPGTTPLAQDTFFALGLLEFTLFAVGSSLVILSMVKERAELRFKTAADTDSLTRIGNRRAFMQSGQMLLDICQQQRQPVALLLCDMDAFKAFNNQFGHTRGDEVLQQFGASLTERLRKNDVYARIGGEEFACLVMADAEEANELAERLCNGLASSEQAQAPTVSIGVAESSQAGYDLSRLLLDAERALRAAQLAGGNRVYQLAPQSSPAE